jgi:hypothetical protein
MKTEPETHHENRSDQEETENGQVLRTAMKLETSGPSIRNFKR